jgi:hypothetical protein
MDAKIIQQPFRTLLTSISNQSQISQPETKLTRDPLDDHTSEEVLTTKKTVSQGLQPGCQRSTTASPAFGLAVAGGILPRPHQSVKLPKQESDTILNLPENAQYFPTVVQKTTAWEPQCSAYQSAELESFCGELP